MKRIFSIIAIAVVMSACTNKAKEEAVKQAAVKAVKDSLRVDSFQKAEIVQKQKQAEIARVAEERRVLLLAEQREANAAPATSQSTTTTTTKKKGWSSAAKGTLIGAGAGAVGGALIGKGKGAIIGGVAGAGAGYLIGRGQDKKSGRAQ